MLLRAFSHGLPAVLVHGSEARTTPALPHEHQPVAGGLLRELPRVVLLPRVGEHALRSGCRQRWQPRLLVGVADGQDDVLVQSRCIEDDASGKGKRLSGWQPGPKGAVLPRRPPAWLHPAPTGSLYLRRTRSLSACARGLIKWSHGVFFDLPRVARLRQPSLVAQLNTSGRHGILRIKSKPRPTILFFPHSAKAQIRDKLTLKATLGPHVCDLVNTKKLKQVLHYG